MKVLAYHITKDRECLADPAYGAPPIRLVSGLDIEEPGGFGPGPVTPRVAVVDFDADGRLRPGAVLEPDRRWGRSGRYRVPAAVLEPLTGDEQPEDYEDPSFVQVSTLALVYRTMRFFERYLGRPSTWAFAGQLLVVPRAGEMRNAFYDRATQSLQFFEYRIPRDPDKPEDGTRTILTALSPDIVAHETTHALLDGVVPELFDALTPDALALHESIADIVALLLPMASDDDLARASLDLIASGTLDVYEAMGRLAEEFGRDRHRTDGRQALRTARNRRTLRASDTSRDRHGEPNRVDAAHPHDLSQVFTGAVFDVLFARAERSAKDALRAERAHGPAKAMARLLIPALDLLPPGEVTFADMAQAMGALAGTQRHGKATMDRLRAELVARGVAEDADALRPPAAPTEPLPARDVAALGGSLRAVRGFVRRRRALLGIPDGVEAHVEPCRTAAWPGTRPRRRILLRVSWPETESHAVGAGLGRRWQVRHGVTLAVDPDTRRIVSRLASDRSARARTARGTLLRRLAAEGALRAASQARDPTGRPLAGVLAAEPAGGGALRVRGSLRMLHLTDCL